MENTMSFQLPNLPYEMDALEPYISKETLEYHYGKHHKTYVDNLNKLVEGTDVAKKTLEEIIKSSTGGIFNNAAQVWNHTFYWHCMKPHASQEPTGALAKALNHAFGSLAEFKEQFSKVAATTFGSGWAWLVKTKEGKLEIVSTSNAANPMTENKKPLLTCDVWEHAYYIDYRNARLKYIENFWHLINWEFVETQFEN